MHYIRICSTCATRSTWFEKKCCQIFVCFFFSKSCSTYTNCATLWCPTSTSPTSWEIKCRKSLYRVSLYWERLELNARFNRGLTHTTALAAELASLLYIFFWRCAIANMYEGVTKFGERAYWDRAYWDRVYWDRPEKKKHLFLSPPPSSSPHAACVQLLVCQEKMLRR